MSEIENLTINTKARKRASTAKHHAFVENGDVRMIVETEAKTEAFVGAVSRSTATGAPISPKHRDIRDLVRARFAAKGVTLDSLIDTLEDARLTATRGTNSEPDHKTRMEAVKIEASMMGLTDDKATPTAQASDAATFTAEELKGKSRDEIVASVLRKLRVVQSNGSVAEEDIVVDLKSVETLSRYSKAAVGHKVAGDVSVKIRPGSKIDPLSLGEASVESTSLEFDDKTNARLDATDEFSDV
jgi:hypothetical protein